MINIVKFTLTNVTFPFGLLMKITTSPPNSLTTSRQLNNHSIKCCLGRDAARKNYIPRINKTDRTDAGPFRER